MPAGSGVTATSSPTAAATRSSICRTRRSPTRSTAIDLATGVTDRGERRRYGHVDHRRHAIHRSSASGTLQISTGTTADLSIVGTGNALSALGLTGNTGTGTRLHRGSHRGAGSLSGKTLTFTSFNGGTAVNVTFGDGSNGTVKTLDQLNAALLANNLQRDGRLDRQADDLHHQRLCFVDPRFGDGRRC